MYNNLLFKCIYAVHVAIKCIGATTTYVSYEYGMFSLLEELSLQMFCNKIIERTIADVRRIKEDFLFAVLINRTALKSYKSFG